MRIISGLAKGMRLHTPAAKSQMIRPTADKVREALFSILGSTVYNAKVLDLYAGTGALGLEALSRGAAQAVFVDQHPKALALIKKNVLKCIAATSISREIQVIQRDLSRNFATLLSQTIGSSEFDIIFADPPYGRGLGPFILSSIEQGDLLKAKGVVVIEESIEASPPAGSRRLQLIEARRYGDTGLFFYGFSNN